MTALAVSAAAAADSLPGFHFLVPRTMNVSDVGAFLEKWHDFFLLSGTAAVTLVGLLFLSMSFNLEVLLHESKSHLLDHARAIMICYTFIMVLSLSFLVPQAGFAFAGMLLVAFSLMALGLQAIQMIRRRSRHLGKNDRFLRRRGAFLIVGYLLALTNGLAMLLDPKPVQVFNMVGLVCMLLGNAVGSSWDLLVRVAQQRVVERALERAEPAAPTPIER